MIHSGYEVRSHDARDAAFGVLVGHDGSVTFYQDGKPVEEPSGVVAGLLAQHAAAAAGKVLR